MGFRKGFIPEEALVPFFGVDRLNFEDSGTILFGLSQTGDRVSVSASSFGLGSIQELDATLRVIGGAAPIDPVNPIVKLAVLKYNFQTLPPAHAGFIVQIAVSVKLSGDVGAAGSGDNASRYVVVATLTDDIPKPLEPDGGAQFVPSIPGLCIADGSLGGGNGVVALGIVDASGGTLTEMQIPGLADALGHQQIRPNWPIAFGINDTVFTGSLSYYAEAAL